MYFLSQNCQIHFMLQMEIIGKLLSFAGYSVSLLCCCCCCWPKYIFHPWLPEMASSHLPTICQLFAKHQIQNVQKTNIPLVFGIENNGERLWSEIFEKSNPSPPSAEMRGEAGKVLSQTDNTTILSSTIGKNTFKVQKTELGSNVQMLATEGGKT